MTPTDPPNAQTAPQKTGPAHSDLTSHQAPFGANLEPALMKACDGRLSNVRWFRTDWQRGGALTGYGDYDTGNGIQAVVIKLPVPPQERRWLLNMQVDRHELGDITPRLFAHGVELGGYDLAWLVMEKLSYGPLDHSWGGAEFNLLIDSIARFYAVAGRHPVNMERRRENWPAHVDRARKKLRDIPGRETQTWNKQLKAFSKKLKKLLKIWNERDLSEWRHGDVHLGNAMTREPAPAGPALIFDFALVQPGHWVEDAVYLEHLYWVEPGRLNGCNPLKQFAAARKANGLNVDADYPKLANIRRAMLAATAPVSAAGAGNPVFVRTCMEKLEALMGQLKQVV